MLVKLGDCYVDPEEIAGITHGRGAFEHNFITIMLRSGCQVSGYCENLEADLVTLGLLEASKAVSESNTTDSMTYNERMELIKFAKQGFRFVAKSDTGFVHVFREKPFKDGAYWSDGYPSGRCLGGDYEWLDPDGPAYYIGDMLDGGEA